MKRSRREASSLSATEQIVKKKTSFGLKKFCQMQFRSSYEYAFAVYLKELGIGFEYESCGEPIKTMAGATLHYIPDFYLPSFNMYVEIENNPSRRLNSKMYAFQQQNPDQKFKLVTKKMLRELFDCKISLKQLLGIRQ